MRITAKFEIWCSRPDGSEFMAFTWTRSADGGCARARRDAAEHGIDIVDVWAVPVRSA